MKSSSDYYKSEMERNILLFELLSLSANKPKIKQNWFNMKYLEKRNNIIDYLRRLVRSYDYDEEIYFYSIELIDSLLLNNRNLILDLTVISCVLISGMII